ncbi:MAG: phosphoserine phosphatase SerB [Anderseniella sp.]|nr:phosphoserine phosphatase SerB [Anderseniella sp.]
MPQLLSLIADPQKAPLTQDVIDTVRAAAVSLGASLADGRWLSPGEAWETPVEDLPPETIEALRMRIAGAPADVNLVAQPGLRRLLLADMDSTMIEQECIDELADMAGAGEAVRAITARAMNGELEFEDALRARVRTLEGLPAGIIAEVIASRISFMPGGRELIATMRAMGAHCALISGGFTHFTAHVAGTLGFDQHQANQLLEEAGKLTGKVAEPILGRDAKVTALNRIASGLGISPAEALTVGDGANDVPMLKAAGLGVALHAKPAVRAQVPVQVNHGNLTALLFLQGIPRSEFVS